MLNNSNIKTQEVIKNLELAVKSLMNKNAVIYSNRSKSTESLSNGSCSLTINTLNKSFVFSYGTPCLGRNNVIINPLNQAISNLNLINDIHVDDIITAQNIMKNQYLIDMFSNIDAVLNLYKKFVVIDEQNESVSLTRGSVKIAKLISEQITSKSLNTESLLINGVDLVKELNDLNRYVDRFVEETDLNFTIVNKEINDFKTDATNKFEVYDESISNLNTNVISINEQIIDIDNNYHYGYSISMYQPFVNRVLKKFFEFFRNFPLRSRERRVIIISSNEKRSARKTARVKNRHACI